MTLNSIDDYYIILYTNFSLHERGVHMHPPGCLWAYMFESSPIDQFIA